MARIITVTSGKGGVGKTNISANMALHLASLGHRTCLFDADLGLANINILLGLYPEYNLEDVILNNKTVQDIIIRDYDGMDIIPGSSGIEKLANLEHEQIDQLVKSFSEFDSYDFFFFDTSSGASKEVISFCRASSEVVLVITPEPTSLSDAYGLLKILSLNGFNGPVMVVVNQSGDAKTANIAYTKLKKTVHKYLPINIVPLGLIVHDDHVAEAVKEQKPFISLYPNSNISKCIKNIAKRFVEKEPEDIDAYALETFWTKFLSFSGSPLKSVDTKTDRKRHEADAVSSSKPACLPETSDIVDMVRKNHMLLTKLEETVSSVCESVGAIRKVIEDGSGLHPEIKRLPEHAATNMEVSNPPSKKGSVKLQQEPVKVTGKIVRDNQQGIGVAYNKAIKGLEESTWLDCRRTTQEVSDERRNHPRVDFHCPVTIEGVAREQTVTDISLGGIFIECESALRDRFQQGQTINLSINFPTEDELIKATVEVAHVVERGIGCKFIGLSQRSQKAIQKSFDLAKRSLPIYKV
jgi:MinD-like ATPase involved in chromosome partitioning or flagellar assembly